MLAMVAFFSMLASETPTWVSVPVGVGSLAWVAWAFFAGKLHSNAELEEWKQLYRDEREARKVSEEATREALEGMRLVTDTLDALKLAAKGT